MRGGKFISVNNILAQEHVSSKNRLILNFRVIAMCDIKVEKYILISGFLAFLEVEVLGIVLI